MEFTKEILDSFLVDEKKIEAKIAQNLAIREGQAHAVVALLNEGCTVPFIARYRKEAHGSLDEVAVRECERLLKSFRNLEERRLEILRGIFDQGKLTQEIFLAVNNAETLSALEDLWVPFKKKKKTRGMIAIEKSLEPLADFIETATENSSVEKKAQEFIRQDENADLCVATAQDAISGASDILAERISRDADVRKLIRDFYDETAKIVSKGIVAEGEDEKKSEENSVYKDYWDYSEEIFKIKPHRIFALNRGEREGVLNVSLKVDEDEAIKIAQKKYSPKNKYFSSAIEDGVIRLLSPSILREIRSDQTEKADAHGIGVFGENLKNLLMTRPLKGSRVLGVDPGIRTGTKCAALDETGKYLGSFLIKQVADPKGAAEAISAAIEKYKIEIVAVGNGTGSHEVQEVVAKVLSEKHPQTVFTVVDESGASVYSASDVAREEFPDLDLTIRGAISMGRRLQDPLSELVKIDPKSIGVGLYQHDVNQKKLSEALDETVESVVNGVGVNLNTASASLLKYVSGISSLLAKKIVAYREQNGIIKNREELKKVNGMGPKAFEQCAGFLKIAESENPLDNTRVHPENYAAASEILPFIREKKSVPENLKKSLQEKYNVGTATLNDIIEELMSPCRDPREDCPAPVMQKGAVQFEDLKIGMKVMGKIRNVVDFGAFVDVGLHETALVHVSQMSDDFVKDPSEVAKVGDVFEFTIIDLDSSRKRISLSLKSDAKKNSAQNTPKENGAKKKVVVKKSFSQRQPSDGTKYNPFAQLLKNR